MAIKPFEDSGINPVFCIHKYNRMQMEGLVSERVKRGIWKQEKTIIYDS